MPLDILFEDHHLIVVNKPAPLLTQAPAHLPSLESMVKSHIKEKYAKPAGVYLGVPHRLDRPVSGVVCFTRNTKASQRVHEQFEHRTVTKTYWALVVGHVEPAAGVWEDWMIKLHEESRSARSESGVAGAKLATLEYRVVSDTDEASLLELNPKTGRMHQLRVQCAWRGHPVLGDSTYAPAPPFGPPADCPRDRVIALHARRLEIEHPFRKTRMVFVAPLPEYWPASVRASSETGTLITPSSEG